MGGVAYLSNLVAAGPVHSALSDFSSDFGGGLEVIVGEIERE